MLKNDKLLLFYPLLNLSTFLLPPTFALTTDEKADTERERGGNRQECGARLYIVLGFETFCTCLRRKVSETRRQTGLRGGEGGDSPCIC